jgi:rhodanese-related sulfurtransferase
MVADLRVHFTKASDAANRAVMADTDEVMRQAGAEAKQETDAVASDSQRLGELLQGLHAADEVQRLAEFREAFTKYQTLDREILDLASASTNLKAQRLSFGSARAAADALRDALEPAKRVADGREGWHIRALADEVLLGVRDVQALQAPHIAETQDVVMDELEKRMAAGLQAARDALGALSELRRPDLRPALNGGAIALDQFAQINAQIVQLSRRNSNVRSLALSLGQKRVLAAACEARLNALSERLAQRKFTATR